LNLHLARVSHLLLLVPTLGIACSLFTGPDNDYRVPLQTDDGWETASLDEVGMAPESLLALLDLIDSTETIGFTAS